jgi:DNA-binding MarR family transcriptional regulator
MKNRIVPDFELAFENPGNSTGFSVWQLSNLWQRKLRERLDSHGVTHVQFLLLNCLAALNKNQPYAITQRMLSAFSGCDKMMTSKVLRTLESRKLVQRKNHHSDTRSRSLLLTAKGMEVLQQATASFQLAEAEVFESLGKKEKGFGKKLRKLVRQYNTESNSD